MKNEGIILDTVDYKETSKIIHLYTKDGKLSVKAIGAMSPKKGLLGFITTGNTVSFVATDATLPSVTEYEVLSSVYSMVEDLARVRCFGVLLEVIQGIPEDAPHEKLYPYIKKTLLDIQTENPKKVLCIFLIKLLFAFGVAPNLKSCVHCGKPEAVFLDLHSGGALCSSCSTLKNADELYIWKEYYYDKKSISEYTACNYDALLTNLRDYYQRYTHLYLRMNEIISKK